MFNSIKKYGPFAKFILPLALSNMSGYLGNIVLFRTVTSFEGTQAGFGIGNTLVPWISACLGTGLTNITIVIVRSQRDRKMAMLAYACMSIVTVAFFLLLGLTSFGTIILSKLYNENSSTIAELQSFLWSSGLVTVVEGVGHFHAGILLKYKRSITVSVSAIASIIVQIIAVNIIVDNIHFSKDNIIFAPVIALLLSQVVRSGIIMGVYYKCVHGVMPTEAPTDFTGRELIVFAAPVILGNYLIGRGDPYGALVIGLYTKDSNEADSAQAVFAVVNNLGRLFYNWLFYLSLIRPAFYEDAKEPEDDDMDDDVDEDLHIVNNLRYTDRHYYLFGGICLVFILLLSAPILFYSSAVIAICHHVLDQNMRLSEASVAPARLTVFFPVTFVIISAFYGDLLVAKKTSYVIPAFVIYVTLKFLSPLLWSHMVSGASMGILAMVTGYAGEAVFFAVVTIMLKRGKEISPPAIYLHMKVAVPRYLRNFVQPSDAEREEKKQEQNHYNQSNHNQSNCYQATQ